MPKPTADPIEAEARELADRIRAGLGVLVHALPDVRPLARAQTVADLERIRAKVERMADRVTPKPNGGAQ